MNGKTTARFLLLLGLFTTGACTTVTPTPDVNPPPIETIEVIETPTAAAPSPTATETQQPVRSLTVCAGQEPDSLFFYAGATDSKWSILEAIYDGPADTVNFKMEPVILSETPTETNGRIILEPVEVKSGDLIIDANGNWAQLVEGVSFTPAGCTSQECAQAYFGKEPVEIDSLVVRFELLPGILWSDGTPVTAKDSVYSFELAKSYYPAVRSELVSYTQSYLALDEKTVEWRGIPGYRHPRAAEFFFTPLPWHAWGHLQPEELFSAPLSAATPLGWGPYVIDEWVHGDHISLRKNPVYFRAAEGLPHFDVLTYRFVSSGTEAIDALISGECDIADRTTQLEADAIRLFELQADGLLQISQKFGTAWEQLTFGISPIDPERLSFFRQKEVRQAVALCIDRQVMTAGQVYSLPVPTTYTTPGHPLENPTARRYDYSPQQGAELLAAAGWIDHDNHSETARVALGVPGVPDGTPFEVDFLTLSDEQRQMNADFIQQSLADCGIQVNITIMEWNELLAAGPEGPVFGRQFDLAQYGWNTSLEPPCSLYLSEEIPGPYPEFPKGWGGANASGYSSAEFDQTCRTALSSLPDWPVYQESHVQAQAIFAEDLPVLPLYLHSEISAARPDFCGLQESTAGIHSLWNLEALDYGPDCQQ